MTQDELKKRLQHIYTVLMSQQNEDPDARSRNFYYVRGYVEGTLDGTLTCSWPEGTGPWVMLCPHATRAEKTDEARVAEFLQHHQRHLNCSLEEDDKKVLWLKNGLSLVCEYRNGERRFDWRIVLRVKTNDDVLSQQYYWMDKCGWFYVACVPPVAQARAWQATVWKNSEVMIQTGEDEWKGCGKLTFPERG